MSSSANRITGVLAETADEIAILSDSAADQDRVAVARDALATTRRARDVLDSVDLGPATGLMRSLDDGRQRFETELAGARDLLDQVVAAAGVAEFLEGPATYLVLTAPRPAGSTTRDTCSARTGAAGSMCSRRTEQS